LKWGAQPPLAAVRRALASNENANDKASLAARGARALPTLPHAAAAGVIFSRQKYWRKSKL